MIKNFKNHVFKNVPKAKVIKMFSETLHFHQKASKSLKNNSSSPTSTAKNGGEGENVTVRMFGDDHVGNF